MSAQWRKASGDPAFFSKVVNATDGSTSFLEERRQLRSTTERLTTHALGYRIRNVDPADRYATVKDVITDPHYACVLQHTCQR